ncbi:MAG: hypothetical protein ACR2L8_06405 [Solirubrobacteraceae bacterium]
MPVHPYLSELLAAASRPDPRRGLPVPRRPRRNRLPGLLRRRIGQRDALTA